ncbi:NAD(P)/FAD-dependent oxidoreductase [Nocardioides zeae]|uniref:Pyridine nucleotide-disulfide oxidoreductase domain-containing protein 2 n=1 Tax=Nocardioides imazamoxiresistens TaxID=3231893 RepID=A0ABU3PRU0_9ACTN|nr:NAD(P)/FAD-dependent oxidoreductase [Nocardioides zeae]MDT9591934.1 NAD(P)/FAD-dependent oxidoreductase [Nocardioides zeae]
MDVTSEQRSHRLERTRYDVVVVGGGHNGLVAAAYLAGAGLSVALLERGERTGGAAVSSRAFAGRDVRLSRYSYLVSLMPQQVVDDLGLDLRLVSRPTASYSPYRRDGRDAGLMVERREGAVTADSFAALTGGTDEYAAWQAFYAEVAELAHVVAPSLTRPLPRVEEVAAQVPDQVWRDVVEQPLGAAIERRFSDDLVRGVVGTDALIGTFASLHDPSLVQNRCFLYHLIGNGTGEWRVPVGGMGAVTDALRAAAERAGAEILTSAEVVRVASEEVTFADADGRHTVGARFVLSGVAPWTLAHLIGEEGLAPVKPQGSQLKINLLLDRLPRLASGEDPALAFAGTLHLNEGAEQLERAYAEAAAGRVPTDLPGEVYCHSLTDPSILGDLEGTGAHTLTYFGLHTPAALFDDPAARQVALDRAIASIDAVLAEPLRSVVATDADGEPCIEAKVPQDVERDLAMPGGHIFHGDLEWPWAPSRAALDTPERAWGVETSLPQVLLCGSGARRGGAVSGIGGHNAAQAVLASI